MLHFLDRPEELHPLTTEDPSAFSPPPAFGPFRVLHQIGVGALGPVFRTYEPTRDRLVAVKAFRLDIIPEQAQALADALSRATEAGLFHPSIVEPIAAGIEGTVAYRAEEYVAAESLDVAMRHYAPAPMQTALPFITQLAGAIDFARAAGIGHGALHPRDIFVTPEEARATGFGVVEALESLGIRAPIRRPYSAPERIAGAAWSTPADIFALAAIAYELLTARRPAGTGPQIGAAPEVEHAAAVHAVLARAMSDDPARRYTSALAFAGALESAARGESQTDAVSAVEAISASRLPVVAPAAPLDAGYIDEPPVDQDRTSAAAIPQAEPLQFAPEVEPQPEPFLFEPELEPEPELKLEPEPEPELELEPELEPEPLEPAELERAEPREPWELEESAVEDTSADRSRPAALPMAMMLILGLLGGFGLAYVVFAGIGKRGAAPAETAAVATPSAPAASAAPNAANAPAPGAREYSDQPITTPKPAAPPAGNSVVPNARTVAPSPRTPAPSAVAPATTPAAKRGEVVIRSTPAKAGVTMNGTWRGRTPLTLGDLPFGRYVIRIVHPGYRVAREEFTLSARDSRQTVNTTLEREAPARSAAPREPEPPPAQARFSGSLFVDSRPQGANVLLDGKIVGKTPLRLADIKIGTHVVRIELAEHRPFFTTARVTAGQEARVTGSLERFQ